MILLIGLYLSFFFCYISHIYDNRKVFPRYNNTDEEYKKLIKWLSKDENLIHLIDGLNHMRQFPNGRKGMLEAFRAQGNFKKCLLIEKHIKHVPGIDSKPQTPPRFKTRL